MKPKKPINTNKKIEWEQLTAVEQLLIPVLMSILIISTINLFSLWKILTILLSY